MAFSSGSPLRLAIASSGRKRALFKSKITSDGCFSRIVCSSLSPRTLEVDVRLERFGGV